MTPVPTDGIDPDDFWGENGGVPLSDHYGRSLSDHYLITHRAPLPRWGAFNGEINFNDYGSQHTNPISNISQTRFDSGNCIFSFGLKPIVIFCWFTCASLKNLYEIPRRGGLVWKLSRGYAFLKFTIDSLFQIEFQSQAYSQQIFQLLWHILHFGQF